MLTGGDAALVTRNGNIRDNRESGQTLILYNGEIVGFSYYPCDRVRRAANAGFAVRFAATCERSFYHRNQLVPEMYTLEPDQVFDETLETAICASYGVPVQASRFNYTDDYMARRPEFQSTEFAVYQNAVLSYLPVPKGSKAKPAIQVASSEGLPIFEVTARHGGYKELSEALSTGANCFVILQRFSRFNRPLDSFDITIKSWL